MSLASHGAERDTGHTGNFFNPSSEVGDKNQG